MAIRRVRTRVPIEIIVPTGTRTYHGMVNTHVYHWYVLWPYQRYQWYSSTYSSTKKVKKWYELELALPALFTVYELLSLRRRTHGSVRDEFTITHVDVVVSLLSMRDKTIPKSNKATANIFKTMAGRRRVKEKDTKTRRQRHRYKTRERHSQDEDNAKATRRALQINGNDKDNDNNTDKDNYNVNIDKTGRRQGARQRQGEDNALHYKDKDKEMDKKAKTKMDKDSGRDKTEQRQHRLLRRQGGSQATRTDVLCAATGSLATWRQRE
jgi:hypothetical protein